MAFLSVKNKCFIDIEKAVTLSTSGSTETFTHTAIKSDSLVDFYSSKWDLVPEDIVCSNGSCVVTLPAVSEASQETITLRVYIRC